MTAYAVRADLYKFGLPRGQLANPARLCASVSADTSVFELDDHGLVDDDAILFREEAGGSLPPEIVEGTTYYAKRLNDSQFQASAAIGGSAINLSEDGESVLVATALPIDDVLEFYSRFADAFMPAHLVPLESPYPITVTALVAELSAKKLLLISGQRSESMDQVELAAKAQLERWAKGVPLRDDRATGPANLAVAETVTRDPRGWGGGSCLL